MVSVLTLPTAPIRTAPAARARFVFRAGRAGALGWTISKIVLEAQRVLLHWLDKLSRGLVPKWHNLAGFHLPVACGSAHARSSQEEAAPRQFPPVSGKISRFGIHIRLQMNPAGGWRD